MATPDDCARELLDTIPLLMQTIHNGVRRERRLKGSVPQLRTLAFLHREPDASLSQAAEHVGLTLPSMSKLVERLVKRGLVARVTCSEDRRRVGLTLTPAGKSVLLAAREVAQQRLVIILASLSAGERVTVVQVMQALRRVFAGGAASLAK